MMMRFIFSRSSSKKTNGRSQFPRPTQPPTEAPHATNGAQVMLFQSFEHVMFE